MGNIFFLYVVALFHHPYPLLLVSVLYIVHKIRDKSQNEDTDWHDEQFFLRKTKHCSYRMAAKNIWVERVNVDGELKISIVSSPPSHVWFLLRVVWNATMQFVVDLKQLAVISVLTTRIKKRRIDDEIYELHDILCFRSQSTFLPRRIHCLNKKNV